jgi:hypothetical protein
MGSESPVLPGSRAESEAASRHRVDPVRYAVQATLVLYLLPVIILVAVIGFTAIVVGRLSSLVARASSLVVGPTPQPDRRLIGSRPILTRSKPRHTRIIR